MYSAYACTCAAHELQKFTYCAGNSMVRKNAAKYVKTLPGYEKRKLEVGSSDVRMIRNLTVDNTHTYVRSCFYALLFKTRQVPNYIPCTCMPRVICVIVS